MAEWLASSSVLITDLHLLLSYVRDFERLTARVRLRLLADPTDEHGHYVSDVLLTVRASAPSTPVVAGSSPGVWSASVGVERWLGALGTSVPRRLSARTHCATGRSVRTETRDGAGAVRSSSAEIWSASEVAAMGIARRPPPGSLTST